MNIGPVNIDWGTLTISANGEMRPLSALPAVLLEVIHNPASNPVAFVLIIFIIVAVILIGIVALFALLNRRGKALVIAREVYEIPGASEMSDGEMDDTSENVSLDTDEANEKEMGEHVHARQVVVEHRFAVPVDPLRKYYAIGTGLLVMALMWVVTGAITQTNFVCRACHGSAVNAAVAAHTKRNADDPHRSVACVRCHESEGLLGALTIAVPLRLSHLVVGTFSGTGVPGYHRVAELSCRRCHRETLVEGKIVHNAEESLAMSHYEPVSAGMSCTRCHTLNTKRQITVETTGMKPCLNCHNETNVTAQCTVCHAKGVWKVASSRPSTDNAQQLVSASPVTMCYDCHNSRSCDSCHGGFRMPHPVSYVGESHIQDYRARGLRACETCHAVGECIDCHGSDSGLYR